MPDRIGDLLGRYVSPVSSEGTPQEQRDAQTERIERRWHQACQMGRCRYASSDVSQPTPPGVDSTTNCGGYHYEKYHDAKGEVYWRARPCVRHLDWDQRRREYNKRDKQKAIEEKATKALPPPREGW